MSRADDLSPRLRVGLGLLILLALLARLPGLTSDLTGHDTWRQADTATIARNFLAEPRILYPRIDWGAPGPGYVEAELQLYPYAVSLLYRVFGETLLVAQLLSLLLAGLSCIVFFRIARRFVSDPCALAGTAFFAMAPLVYRYSRAVMPEATVLLFYLLALERFLAFLDDDRWRTVLAASAAMAVAILVKPTSIHLGLVLCVLVVAAGNVRALFRPKLCAFAVVALAPAVAWYAHAAGLHATYGNTFGVISGGDSKWGSPSIWLDPKFYLGLATIEGGWVAGPVAAVVGLVGLAQHRAPRWRPLTAAWAATLLLYYFITARYSGSGRGLQYHIYGSPLVALAAAGGLEALRGRWPARRAQVTWGVAALTVAAQLPLNAYVAAQRRNLDVAHAGKALAALTAPDELVAVLSADVAMDQGVPNNYQQPDVFFHARRRGLVLAYDQQTLAHLRRASSAGATWFVNFPDLNRAAEPAFVGLLRRLEPVRVGEGFEIYRLPRAELAHGAP